MYPILQAFTSRAYLSFLTSCDQLALFLIECDRNCDFVDKEDGFKLNRKKKKKIELFEIVLLKIYKIYIFKLQSNRVHFFF
jgi:hypothetical protein